MRRLSASQIEALVHQLQRAARLGCGQPVGVGPVAVDTFQGQLAKRPHILDHGGGCGAADLKQLGVAFLTDHKRVASALDDLVVGGSGFLDQQASGRCCISGRDRPD